MTRVKNIKERTQSYLQCHVDVAVVLECIEEIDGKGTRYARHERLLVQRVLKLLELQHRRLRKHLHCNKVPRRLRLAKDHTAE